MNDDLAQNADPSPRALRTAAQWFARRRASRFTAREARLFTVWRDGDADHRAALRSIETVWLASGEVDGHPEIAVLREQARLSYPGAKVTRRLAIGASLAATLVVAAFGGWFAVQSLSVEEHSFRTGIGQISDIALSDGSRITLDTDTLVRTKFNGGRRMLWLDRGRAFFQVAKDSHRPFVVEAMGKSVTAKGTQFQVELKQKSFTVVLIDGRVKVDFPIDGGKRTVSTDLTSGSQLVASGKSSWVISQIKEQTDLAWMNGQLIFHDRPLREVVIQINRYSSRKVYLSDEDLANRTIYGAFSTSDIDQFVQALIDGHIVAVQSQDANRIVLQSPREKKIAGDVGGRASRASK